MSEQVSTNLKLHHFSEDNRLCGGGAVDSDFESADFKVSSSFYNSEASETTTNEQLSRRTMTWTSWRVAGFFTALAMTLLSVITVLGLIYLLIAGPINAREFIEDQDADDRDEIEFTIAVLYHNQWYPIIMLMMSIVHFGMSCHLFYGFLTNWAKLLLPYTFYTPCYALIGLLIGTAFFKDPGLYKLMSIFVLKLISVPITYMSYIYMKKDNDRLMALINASALN